MIKTMAFLCLYLILIAPTYGQNQSIIKEFWSKVRRCYQYKEMDQGMRYWLNDLAEKHTGNFFKGVALLRNIENEPEFQNKILRTIYIEQMNEGNNREYSRKILSVMCNSYLIGNTVADYILLKFSKDPTLITKPETNKFVTKKETKIITKQNVTAFQKETIQIQESENHFVQIIKISPFQSGDLDCPNKEKVDTVITTLRVKNDGTKDSIKINGATYGTCLYTLSERAANSIKFNPATENGKPIDCLIYLLEVFDENYSMTLSISKTLLPQDINIQ